MQIKSKKASKKTAYYALILISLLQITGCGNNAEVTKEIEIINNELAKMANAKGFEETKSIPIINKRVQSVIAENPKNDLVANIRTNPNALLGGSAAELNQLSEKFKPLNNEENIRVKIIMDALSIDYTNREAFVKFFGQGMGKNDQLETHLIDHLRKDNGLDDIRAAISLYKTTELLPIIIDNIDNSSLNKILDQNDIAFNFIKKTAKDKNISTINDAKTLEKEILKILLIANKDFSVEKSRNFIDIEYLNELKKISDNVNSNNFQAAYNLANQSIPKGNRLDKLRFLEALAIKKNNLEGLKQVAQTINNAGGWPPKQFDNMDEKARSVYSEVYKQVLKRAHRVQTDDFEIYLRIAILGWSTKDFTMANDAIIRAFVQADYWRIVLNENFYSDSLKKQIYMTALEFQQPAFATMALDKIHSPKIRQDLRNLYSVDAFSDTAKIWDTLDLLDEANKAKFTLRIFLDARNQPSNRAIELTYGYMNKVCKFPSPAKISNLLSVRCPYLN